MTKNPKQRRRGKNRLSTKLCSKELIQIQSCLDYDSFCICTKTLEVDYEIAGKLKMK